MIEFKAPQKVKNPNNWPSIFEAGSIDQGSAEDWQSKITDALDGIPCVVLNPRRDDWDSTWKQDIKNDKFREQVEWELDGMESATYIAMCLTKDSKAPISLLELGLHAAGGKMMVFCPEGFYRKGNVDIVCKRYHVPVYDDFEEFTAEMVRRMALPNTMRKKRSCWVTAEDRVASRAMLRAFVTGLRYQDKPHFEIPQFPIQAADANMEYDRKLKEVRKLINALQGLLNKHEARQGGRPQDWGFVGDLESLAGQLTEMVRFIGGGTRG